MYKANAHFIRNLLKLARDDRIGWYWQATVCDFDKGNKLFGKQNLIKFNRNLFKLLLDNLNANITKCLHYLQRTIYNYVIVIHT